MWFKISAGRKGSANSFQFILIQHLELKSRLSWMALSNWTAALLAVQAVLTDKLSSKTYGWAFSSPRYNPDPSPFDKKVFGLHEQFK